jgi:signal transduction histidine kinase
MLRHFFIFLFILFSQNTWAQHIYEKYTPTQGLVDVRVNKIVQDKFGRLVFLTWDGFSIYDGQRFQNHSSIDGKSIGILYDFQFDADSNLALFPANGGSIHIGKTKLRFDSLAFKDIGPIHLVRKINAHKHLLGNNNGFYFEENGKTKKLINNNPKIQVDFIKLESPFILGRFIVFYSWEIVYKGANLYLYDIEKEMFVDKMPLRNMNLFEADMQQHLFVRDINGFQQLDVQKMNEGKLALQPTWFAKHIPNNFEARSIKFDNQNNLWLCDVAKGTLQIKPNGNIDHFLNEGTSSLVFANLFTDKENNIWLINFGKEINKIVQSNFELLIDKENQKQIKVGHCSYNLSPDSIVFISTNQAYVIHQQKLTRLPKNPFTTFSLYWKNHYWQIPDKKTAINDRQKIIQQITDVSDNNLFTLSPKIKLDGLNNLLIAGYQLRIFTQNETLYSIEQPYLVDNAAVDEKNNYWCFARGGFVTKINLRQDGFQVVFTKHIPDFGVRCSMHWNKDTFIVGTRNFGLIFLKANQDTVIELKRINKENNGISNNFILNTLKIDDQKIALATASGVDIINFYNDDTIVQRLSLSVNNFEPFYQLSADRQKNIYAISELTSNAFVYSPHKFDSIHYQPNAFISQVLVNGNPINENENEFAYTQNNFVFEISAPSFLDNNNINFYYTLAGFHNKWPIKNNKGVFEINNLAPGDYQMIIKIVYPNKIYKDELLKYSFHIRQPFWKTWWFLLGCLLFFGSLIFGITRLYFVQQLRAREAALEKQKAIEKERNRIAADMHDDMGSGLTKITYLSQMVSTNQQQNEQLTKINQTSAELIENMGEIIWAMKPENNTIEELLIYIKSYTVDYCANNNLNCTIDLPEKLYERIVPGENRRNIFLAIKEILHNIVKHAKAKNVAIKASFDSKEWVVQIKDDGIGMEASQMEKTKKGNGMRNLQKRLESVHGTIEVISDNGTTIYLRIPL